MNKLTKTEKQIQMSVAWNNSSRLTVGLIVNGGFKGIENRENIAEDVDQLARLLYAKQIKFWEEIEGDEKKH